MFGVYLNSMDDSIQYSEINNYIDKLHFKSSRHVLPKLKKAFPDISNDVFEQVLRDRLKDKRIKSRKIEPYYVKIFSTSMGSWFHDILDNGDGHTPRYWHVFIGTNNHYGVAYELPSRHARDVYKTLEQFINDHKPSKLTSDDESAFTDKNVVKLLKDNNVNMHIVTDKNHSSLGIIDRFIRTLRDMNTPHEHSKRQSNDPKYKSFTPTRMKKLLDIYNTSYHGRIKCTPTDMLNDPKLEKEYIFEQLKLRDKRESRPDFNIEVGSFVRYILPRADGKTKKRYQISRECYKVEAKRGHTYILIAKDGTVKEFPRYRIMLAQKDGRRPRNCQWADTFGTWNGYVKRIIHYDEKKHRYTVAFSVPGKEDYIDSVPESYIEHNYPHLRYIKTDQR